jgi:tripartite-type tricarboxylate transporter receptor subunit TctC
MKTRFGLACLFALAALTACWTSAAVAQDYPNRPIKWVVTFPAGGPTDVAARIMAPWLSEHLGQQVIVENRAGSGGNIGTHTVITSPPDGYTLLFCTIANAISVSLYSKLPFDFMRDMVPVAGTLRMTNVMEVHPSVPARTVSEFIAYAKANPGKVSYASAGHGTSIHLSAELFKVMTGVNLVHVPYRGSAPALVDMLSGQVQVMFDNLTSSIQHIKDGKLRALAVTAAARSNILPDVPTVGETVPGFEATAWWGVCAPKGTPAAIVDKLTRAFNALLADPKMNARFADLGATPISGTAAEYGTLMASEIDKWAKVVSFAGVKID